MPPGAYLNTCGSKHINIRYQPVPVPKQADGLSHTQPEIAPGAPKPARVPPLLSTPATRGVMHAARGNPEHELQWLETIPNMNYSG